MSINRKYRGANLILPNAVVTAEDARTSNHALSGDPAVLGNVPGVAMADADSSGKTRIQIDGIHTLLVAGIDDGGTSGADRNVAVNGGDKVYFDHTKAPPLSKRAGGIFFGYAFGDAGVQQVASGATTTKCDVLLVGG